MDEILASIQEIPPFPQVVLKAMDIISDPEYSVENLTRVISLDQAITANVLKICNSAYFGLSREVGSLKEAVVYLGATQLRQLLLAGGAKKVYDQPHEGYTFFAGELWQHAVACAVMAQVVVGHFKKSSLDSQMVFTAALLHDVGKVVLSTYVQQEFAHIEAMVAGNKCSFQEAEREILGYDHAEIGGKLTEFWQFPEPIVAAIRHHHQPEQAPKTHRLLTELVSFADSLVILVGYGTAADGLAYHMPHALADKASLQTVDVEILLAEFQQEMVKTSGMIGVQEE